MGNRRGSDRSHNLFSILINQLIKIFLLFNTRIPATVPQWKSRKGLVAVPQINSGLLGLALIGGCIYFFVHVVFHEEMKLTDAQVMAIKLGMTREEFVQIVNGKKDISAHNPKKDNNLTYHTVVCVVIVLRW